MMKISRENLNLLLGHGAFERISQGQLSREEEQGYHQRLQTIYRAMLSYLPSGVIRHRDGLAAGKRIEQTLVMADVTGFTSMSEKLSRIGKEGAEELTNIINSYFSPLIKIVIKYGGDVVSFSGDAFTAGF